MSLKELSYVELCSSRFREGAYNLFGNGTGIVLKVINSNLIQVFFLDPGKTCLVRPDAIRPIPIPKTRRT